MAIYIFPFSLHLSPFLIKYTCFGQLTQLVECLRHMEEVRGSSPLLPTTKTHEKGAYKLAPIVCLFCCFSLDFAYFQLRSQILLRIITYRSLSLPSVRVCLYLSATYVSQCINHNKSYVWVILKNLF